MESVVDYVCELYVKYFLWCNCNDNGNALANQIPVFEGWNIVFGIRFFERPFCVYSTLKASRAGRKFPLPVATTSDPSTTAFWSQWRAECVSQKNVLCVDGWLRISTVSISVRPTSFQTRPLFLWNWSNSYSGQLEIPIFDNLKRNFILIYIWYHLKSFCHLFQIQFYVWVKTLHFTNVPWLFSSLPNSDCQFHVFINVTRTRVRNRWFRTTLGKQMIRLVHIFWTWIKQPSHMWQCMTQDTKKSPQGSSQERKLCQCSAAAKKPSVFSLSYARWHTVTQCWTGECTLSLLYCWLCESER